MGISLRPYGRWQRLQHAVRLVADGQTLTAAARSAEFTDGPHFTRVFRHSFGTELYERQSVMGWNVDVTLVMFGTP